jgi:uncharacterized DUF497 family protein
LRRISDDVETRYATTEHARAQLESRGITLNDIRTVLTRGAVISDEEESDGRHFWRVEGTTIDGDKLEVVVEVSEPDRIVKIITASYATALEEATSSELSKPLIEKRVDDWVSRIDEAYAEVRSPRAGPSQA